jgi:molybdopterin-guanine dinucleotide biosynthesis protein A
MNPTPIAAPPLYGLVLAGGRGTRLGRDKGVLDYHGVPQARWAMDLMTPSCERRFVSVRAEQAKTEPYRNLPLIVDRSSDGGPAAGLEAALHECPGVAWLLVATDMPLLDRAVLAALVAARDPRALATAYVHADGTPEPLCAIWEPSAREALAAASAVEHVSLRRLLGAGPAKLIPIDRETALASVNTREDDARIRRSLSPHRP